MSNDPTDPPKSPDPYDDDHLDHLRQDPAGKVDPSPTQGPTPPKAPQATTVDPLDAVEDEPFDDDEELRQPEGDPVPLEDEEAPTPALNKKLLIGIGAGLAVVIAVSIAFSASPSGANSQQGGNGKPVLAGDNPRFNLIPTQQDNLDRFPAPKAIDASSNPDLTGNAANGYVNYKDPQTQRMLEEQAAAKAKRDAATPLIVERNDRQYPVTQSVSGNSTNPMPPKVDPDAREPGFFFPSWQEASFRQASGSSGAGASLSGDLVKATELNIQTDFEKANQQKQKQAYLDKQVADYNNYSQSLWTRPIDPTHELKATSLIPIILLTAVDSDNPGQITAQVWTDVYDSYSGQTLLIPKGTKVMGTYNSQVSFSQVRLQVIWQRLILPNFNSINLIDTTSVDPSGKSGLTGSVDNHWADIASTVTAASAFDIAVDSTTAALSNIPGLDALKNTVTTREGVAKELSSQMISRVLNRQPTITIPEGTPSNILISKDIILPEYIP